MKTATIGAVSSGTMRNHDLADAFLWELDYLGHQDATTLRTDWEAIDEDDTDGGPADELVHAMFDALEECAPPYCYFGAFEGDGACYGFFPVPDVVDFAMANGCPVVDDLAEVLQGETEAMIINDHGNISYGSIGPDGEFKEVWSCV